MAADDLERARNQWSFRGSRRPEWAIEPGPGQESVWDYPRPPRMDSDERLIRVAHGGTTIAETRSAIRVLETASPPTFYIPRQDVRTALLRRARGASICEWKGSATYWSLDLGGCVAPNVAWSYETPFPEFDAIKGYVGFYPDKLDCFVDRQKVSGQLGGFYGGWVTPEIVGPFKGQAGTGSW
jgi:uncharacterized protein (DUF427 family)